MPSIAAPGKVQDIVVNIVLNVIFIVVWWLVGRGFPQISSILSMLVAVVVVLLMVACRCDIHRWRNDQRSWVRLAPVAASLMAGAVAIIAGVSAMSQGIASAFLLPAITGSVVLAVILCLNSF
jgi:uncharacterized membrane protein